MKCGLFLFVLLLASVTVAAQTNDADKITVLQSEVRKLRLELLQQRIEFQQWKIEQLEAALQQTREELAKLDAEERGVQQVLSDAGAADEAEILSYKTELRETTLKKTHAQQAASQQRETELQNKLQREQQTLQTLVQKMRQVKATE